MGITVFLQNLLGISVLFFFLKNRDTLLGCFYATILGQMGDGVGFITIFSIAYFMPGH